MFQCVDVCREIEKLVCMGSCASICKSISTMQCCLIVDKLSMSMAHYIDEDRRAAAGDAEEEARAMEKDDNTIWTDGSRLEDGRVGAGVAWYEKERERGEGTGEGKIIIKRRDYRTGGDRRKGQAGYLGESRSIRAYGAGWRDGGFSLGKKNEAYDGELAALIYGLVVLHGRDQEQTDYTVFTDSTAAMRRLMGDAPGPGQDMAIHAIDIAERIVQRGNTITIRWTPAHVGVEGNERADRAAKDAATLPPLRGVRDRVSLAYQKRRITEEVTKSWLEDTRKRRSEERSRGAYKEPGNGAKPRIRRELRKARKGVASRFFQLLSGHAMIAPFLKEKWKWIDSDICWWCEKKRQSRDHLFKECIAWKEEIARLWEEVGKVSGKRRESEGSNDRGPYRSRRGFGYHVRQARARPSNTTIRELLSNDRYTGAVLDFLGNTRVGEVKAGIICR